MNLLDFEYLEKNLYTSHLTGSDSCIANLFLLQEKYNTELRISRNFLYRYYYGDENRTGYGFPIPLVSNGNTLGADEVHGGTKHAHGATGSSSVADTSPAGSDTLLVAALEHIISDARTQNRPVQFCLITQEQKNQIDSCLAQNFPDRHVDWKTNRDDSDYIYLQENLADLPGSNYQKKRNHVSRFRRIYGENWEFKPYPENDISQDILEVSQKWYEEKDGPEKHVLQLEHESIKRALEHTELLRLRGGVLYVNGEAAAMTLASPVSDSVLDVIYEKAIGKYEKDGVYSVINQQFAKRCSDFLYLNREEDMGVEGLRKAKLSYKPTMILEKFYGKLC